MCIRDRCTDTAYWGKLLVCTLATSLRMMAIKGAHDREQGNRKIPNNSIDCLFTILKQIQADKRQTANAWVTRTITKKQRDMLALLGLENPPQMCIRDRREGGRCGRTLGSDRRFCA